MRGLFWLSDDAWAAIEPHLPKNQPGARRVDDRRVISGILHVVRRQSFPERGGAFVTEALARFLFQFRRQRIGAASGVCGLSVP